MDVNISNTTLQMNGYQCYDPGTVIDGIVALFAQVYITASMSETAMTIRYNRELNFRSEALLGIYQSEGTGGVFHFDITLSRMPTTVTLDTSAIPETSSTEQEIASILETVLPGFQLTVSGEVYDSWTSDTPLLEFSLDINDLSALISQKVAESGGSSPPS